MGKNKKKNAQKLNKIKDTINKRKKRQAKKLNKKLKTKETIIEKVKDIEEIQEIDAIEEKCQDFKERLKIEKTGQFRILAQRRNERLRAEEAEAEKQINLLKTIGKMQKEKEKEIEL